MQLTYVCYPAHHWFWYLAQSMADYLPVRRRHSIQIQLQLHYTIHFNRERRRWLLILPERRVSHIRSCWCITLVTARITYEMDSVMKLQLDLESVPVTHWRIVRHALRRISESVARWVTYIGELHAFLWSYIISSLYVAHYSSIIVLSKHIGW